MNSLDWEDAVRRLQGNLDPNYQPVVNNSMESASRTNTYCQYSRYTVDEPESSMGMNLGSKGLDPPSRNFYTKESEVEVPDGEPFEMDEEDPELTRKRKQLREIEEQIIHKKLAIALKKVEPFVKGTSPSSFSYNEQSVTCEGSTLKDRVNIILQQRHSVSFLSKVQSPKDRMNSSSLSKDGLPQEDHPLKLRVKALMKQRCSDPCVLQTNTVPDVTPPPPSRRVTSPATEENSVNQGFQRFLSVLNKGVDIDMLSRIVNDDSEDLPLGEELLSMQPPVVENKTDLTFRSKSQQSNSAASPLGSSRTNSGERKTDPPSQERCLNERLSLPNDDEENDRGDLCLDSSSPFKSPPAVKKKKKKEENKPNVDEQSVQLQNVLRSLGLSLDVEEMSKLADRTQERLYGKKHESMKADSTGEQESQRRDSHRQHRNSSSSSSRSTSRSVSPSPSRDQCSHSQDSKQRRTSERSGSRDGSRDGLKCQDGDKDSKETQRDIDKDRKDSNETSTYQHPYPQNQEMSPHPHPDAFSTFPDYSLSPYSQYNAYDSVTYSPATNSYWTYTQDAIPPFSYPSGHPTPRNPDHHFPGSVVPRNHVYPHPIPPEDIYLHVNPDLSQSEGQIGSASGPRYLQVICTKQSTTRSCLKQPTNLPRTKNNGAQKKEKNVFTQALEASNQKVNQNLT